MTVLLAFLLPGAAVVYAIVFFTASIVVPVVLIAASGRHAADATRAAGRFRGATLDGIDGHQDLALFGATSQAAGEIADAAAALGSLRAKLGCNGALASAIVQALMAVALLDTLVAGISAVHTASLDGPQIAGLLLAVVASFEASGVLVRSATRLAGSAAAAQRLRDIKMIAPPITEPARPVKLPKSPVITFDRVRFGYDLIRPVLNEARFMVQPGEIVAITGPSGSGKSTIAQLLLRLIDPQGGRVLVGGVDIRETTTKELRARIALMTQDAPVFLDTIRANLAVGREATEAQMWAMLTTVGLADFVRSLPGGLDAWAGEGGHTFSVGQARRLCLARTLLSAADVIVLDEPTSGLDQATEAALLAELPDLLAGRTAIVIVHAAAPESFDRILELHAGQIEEVPRARA
jgi:ATP-binding cassette subfamily C protein CydC